MPNHKSCKKRIKTSLRDRLVNRGDRSRLRSAVKELRALNNKEEAVKKYQEVTRLFDRAAASNLIHKKNADRNKSRLARFVQQLG